jgi:putative transposase
MEADVAAVCGPKSKHNPAREAVRHGSEAGSVTLGGRRVPVRRPRMRTADGAAEMPVPSYELFSSTEILGRMAMGEDAGRDLDSPLPGRARTGRSAHRTRRYRDEQVGDLTTVRRGDRDRAFRAARCPLGALDLVALMIDGVHFGEYVCVVALGIGIDATLHPLALVEGSTENTTTVIELLVGLRERGLDTTQPIFIGIDGAEGSAGRGAAGLRPPGDRSVSVAQAQDVADKLPDHRLHGDQADAGGLPRRVSAADQAQLEALARELDRTHPGAAASLREGMAETLTVLRLGVPPTLARTLRSTNSIESMISIARTHCRNVKHSAPPPAPDANSAGSAPRAVDPGHQPRDSQKPSGDSGKQPGDSGS